MSNQKGLFVPRDNVVPRRISPPVPGFRAGVVTLNLSHCNIKFISRDVPREQHATIKTMKNGGSENEWKSFPTRGVVRLILGGGAYSYIRVLHN